MPSELRLTRANRLCLARAFHDTVRVDIGIDCAIEGQMGQVFVDDADDPRAFKIEQGPFCYFAGDASTPGAHALIESLSPYALAPLAGAWHELAAVVYGARMEAMPRYSFGSSGLDAGRLHGLLDSSGLAKRIVPLDVELAEAALQGHPFVDLSSFDSGQDFAARGIGFCVLEGSEISAAAYSSLVCSKGIEVSLFVTEAQRRRGIGTALASRLLLACLERHTPAHWDAANETSCHIAQRLGYGQAQEYQAYWVRQ